MKHDFNKPIQDVIPHFQNMPCDCVDCVKNAAYTKQLNDRNAVYVNSFDFPDWNDLQISATELLGYATNNGVAVAAAQNAKQLKTAVKAEVDKVNAGGKSTWTNLPKDSSGKAIVPAIEPSAGKKGAVTVDWTSNILSFIGPLKWFLILLAAAIIVGAFIKIKG